DRKQACAKRITRYRPAGLRLPPVIDDRHIQLRLRPLNRGRIGTLASKKQRTQAGEITIPRELARGILSLDRADRSRRGEQSADPILFDDAPERSRIGGA